ncbi:MAG: thioredoxin family protein [Clostridiales bacterium]|nr:thioredoxin family protein [Clostridiales bacterium]
MITDKNYKEHLKGLQVLEVSGESCANCLTLMPMLFEVVHQRTDITLLHVEASDDTKQFLEEYQIERVPTVLLLDNGKEFARAVGFQPQEIFELWLDAMIEEHLKK